MHRGIVEEVKFRESATVRCNLKRKITGGREESYTPSNNNLDAGLPVQQRRLVRLR